MLKIVGSWDVWDNANHEFLIHWRFMTQHFGVDQVYMVPVAGVSEENLTEAASAEEVINANPDLTPIIVDENGETTLKDFVHPQNALYIFGKVGWSPLDHLPKNYSSIRIPSWAKNPNTSLGMLHPHQAASIVLYDRKTKE